MYFKYKKQTETLLYLHHTLTKDILRSRRGGRFIEQGKKDNISKRAPRLVVAYLDFALCV